METNQAPIKKNPYLDTIIQITQGKNMIADGPLSLQYTKALNEIYKKDVDDETGISMETQALDDKVNKSMWIAATDTRQELADKGQEVGMLYGVKLSDAGMSDVVNITDSVANMSESERDNSVIVLEEEVVLDNSDIEKSPNPFAKTIKDVAAENNVDVHSSLEAYVESTKLPDGEYPGKIKGKKVSFKIGKKTHRFTNDTGVGDKTMECIVVIKKNDVHQINIPKQ